MGLEVLAVLAESSRRNAGNCGGFQVSPFHFSAIWDFIFSTAKAGTRRVAILLKKKGNWVFLSRD